MPSQMPDNSLFLSTAGAYALDAARLQKIFLVLVRAHYANPQNFGEAQEALSEFVFSTDPAKSRMAITDSPDYGKRDTDLFPAITVQAMGMQFQKTTLGDRDPAENTYGTQAATPIQVTHFSKNGREALALACFTMDYLLGYKEIYIQQIGAGRLIPNQLSPVSLIKGPDQADKIYQCTFSFTVEYDYSWIQTEETHLIRHMTLKVADQLAQDIENV